MIEQASRELAKALGRDSWQECEPLVRLVLEAVRQPNDGMLKAGSCDWNNNRIRAGREGIISPDDAAWCWGEMIKALLNDRT